MQQDSEGSSGPGGPGRLAEATAGVQTHRPTSASAWASRCPSSVRSNPGVDASPRCREQERDHDCCGALVMAPVRRPGRGRWKHPGGGVDPARHQQQGRLQPRSWPPAEFRGTRSAVLMRSTATFTPIRSPHSLAKGSNQSSCDGTKAGPQQDPQPADSCVGRRGGWWATLIRSAPRPREGSRGSISLLDSPHAQVEWSDPNHALRYIGRRQTEAAGRIT